YIHASTVSSSGISSLIRSASMRRTIRSQMYPPSRHRSDRACCGRHAPHRASMSSYETGRTRLGVGRKISRPYSVVVVVVIAISIHLLCSLLNRGDLEHILAKPDAQRSEQLGAL